MILNNREHETRLILNIERMTVHNGPGIRTLILFKGCPLNCLWCSTPESQNLHPEIAFYSKKCTGCEKCITLCPLNAISSKNHIIDIDRSICNNCGSCVKVCYPNALQILGYPMMVEDLAKEAEKDLIIYKHSGGGVTISGGEPLLDIEFTTKLLNRLKKSSVNIGIDTCGYVPLSYIQQILPFTDFFLWDIKHMDPKKHKEFTGVSNQLILNNARFVSNKNIPIYIRLPLITTYNDSEENIRATCEFVKTLTSVVEVDLLPLHHLGQARYESLNRNYPIAGLKVISSETLQEIKKLVESYDLKCKIVG